MRRRDVWPVLLILLGACVLIGGIAALLLYFELKGSIPDVPDETEIEIIGWYLNALRA